MSNAKTIARNTTYLFVSDVISHVLSFILVIAIARYLGESGLGKYSFAFSFVTITSILADLGISVFITREIAKDHNNTKRYFRNAMGLKMACGIASIIITSIFIIFLKKSAEDIPLIMLATVVIFFDMLTLGIYSVFQAYERMGFISVVNVIERTIALGLGLTFMMMGYGIVPLLYALVVSYTIRFIISSIYVSRKIASAIPKFELAVWKEIIKGSYPFWFTIVFVSIYFSVDTVMLTYMKDYAVTGLYNAARKLVESLTFIPIVIRFATYPAMSKFHNTSKEFLSILYNRSINYLFIIALPIGIATTILASRFILFFYSEQFLESSLALQILIWAEVFVFMNYMMGFLLNAINKEKIFTVTAVICLMLNVVTNYIFIQKYSLYGAAATTVATEAVNFGLLYYFTAKSGYRLNLKNFIRPIIAGIVMGAFIIGAYGLHLLIIVPLAGIIYLLVLFLMGAIGKEEIDLILGVLKRPSKE